MDLSESTYRSVEWNRTKSNRQFRVGKTILLRRLEMGSSTLAEVWAVPSAHSSERALSSEP